MTTTVLILILIVILIFIVVCGAGLWLVFRQRQAVRSKEPGKETTRGILRFRWRHVILPLAILLLSIILTAYFYHLLPAEVAYHFQPDGSPDRWLSRGMTVVWVVLPQVIFTLVAGAFIWGIAKLGSLFREVESVRAKPDGVLLLMGNMVAMPQIILCFVMLDIFIYNSYQIHIMPIWVFALIIMVLGGIILGMFFIRTIRRGWGTGL